MMWASRGLTLAISCSLPALPAGITAPNWTMSFLKVSWSHADLFTWSELPLVSSDGKKPSTKILVSMTSAKDEHRQIVEGQIPGQMALTLMPMLSSASSYAKVLVKWFAAPLLAL